MSGLKLISNVSQIDDTQRPEGILRQRKKYVKKLTRKKKEVKKTYKMKNKFLPNTEFGLTAQSIILSEEEL
jgi:hypothetical protein